VSENRVLRRTFGPKRDEVTEALRKLHNEKLNDLYSSPNIIRVIRSRIIKWAGHLARMGERKGVYGDCGREISEKDTTWKTQALMGE
jgi:hypothetical protein